jgi:hypothetical protein
MSDLPTKIQVRLILSLLQKKNKLASKMPKREGNIRDWKPGKVFNLFPVYDETGQRVIELVWGVASQKQGGWTQRNPPSEVFLAWWLNDEDWLNYQLDEMNNKENTP